MQLLEGAGVAATVNRADGTALDLFGLNIEGATHVDLFGVDSVSNDVTLSDGASVDAFGDVEISGGGGLTLESGSTFSFFQADTQLDGLAFTELLIDGSSVLNLAFDNVLAGEDELDFALRLDGDAVGDLESLISSGQVTIAALDTFPIEVIRDTSRFGDFTFIGYVGVAVPEPATLPLLFGMAFSALCQRRKRSC